MQSQRINPFSLLGETLGSIGPVYLPLIVIGSPSLLIPIASRLYLPTINSILPIISFAISCLLLGTQISYTHGYFTHSLDLLDIEKAIRQAAKKFLQLILASIIVSLILFLGRKLLFFPGFYMAFRLLFTLYALMIEDLPALDAIISSWQLTKGYWWSIVFAVFLPAIVLVCLFVFISNSVLSLVSFSSINISIIIYLIVISIIPFVVVYSYLLYIKLKEIKQLIRVKEVEEIDNMMKERE